MFDPVAVSIQGQREERECDQGWPYPENMGPCTADGAEAISERRHARIPGCMERRGAIVRSSRLHYHPCPFPDIGFISRETKRQG
jgi:hypothetical protein